MRSFLLVSGTTISRHTVFLNLQSTGLWWSVVFVSLHCYSPSEPRWTSRHMNCLVWSFLCRFFIFIHQNKLPILNCIQMEGFMPCFEVETVLPPHGCLEIPATGILLIIIYDGRKERKMVKWVHITAGRHVGILSLSVKEVTLSNKSTSVTAANSAV